MSTFEEMVGFIKSAYPAKSFNVPCLVGPTGIGKTAAVKQAAAELKDEGLASGKVVTIIASQVLPNEVSGITMPVVESKSMEIFDHYRLSSLQDGDILFFDELLEADQLVLSACLTLIESRELMSGRQLPDVMIVAATNPTIKPDMLKENIRQRFLWREFPLDKVGCRDYIKSQCGFDVGEEVTERLVESGDEYNILTPRSLTKMAKWISTAKTSHEAKLIANNINLCWSTGLGSKLYEAYFKKMISPFEQMKRCVRKSLKDNDVDAAAIDDVAEGFGQLIYNDEVFEQTSLTELIDVLKKLPNWDAIEQQLSAIPLEDDDYDMDVSF